MLKVKVVTVKDYSEKTLTRLQKLGVLHVEEAKELSPIDRAAIENEKTDVGRALAVLNTILDHLEGERIIVLPEEVTPPPLDTIMAEAHVFHKKLSETSQKFDRTQKELVACELLATYLGLLKDTADVSLKDLNYTGTYLFSRVVVLPEESLATFQEKAGAYILQQVTVVSESDAAVYFIARSDDRRTLETLIEDHGIITLKIPDKDMRLNSFLTHNDEVIRTRKEERDALRREMQALIEGDLSTIVIYREILTAEHVRLTVLQQAAEARYVTLIEGYIPETDIGMITSGLKEILDYALITTEAPTIQDDPPTKLKNPQAIKPFEVIVNLFSLPKYGDWDPTPSVAYFFAFFFGIMLNDMVYAFGLLLMARFFLDKLVDDPTSEGTTLFRRVLYISGSVALLFGVLSGTYLGDFFNMFFGVNLKTLALITGIQNKLSDPISFIILSLVIGLIHLNIAHVLGMIKGIKENDKGVVVSKIGLFLIQIFGIPYIFNALLNIDLIHLSAPVYAAFLWPLLGGLILIIAGAFMHMGALGAIFWIFDLTGILGDVMSYSRLAGVGLATFYLASSFNLLSDWVSKTISSFVPGVLGLTIAFIVCVILLVIFHVFNLLLSSLAAFIHSLRLCFVEFLLKFYEGGGREYAPFHLKLRKEVVVGKKS